MGFFYFCPMRIFWHLYRLLQILSLDIVGGALLCAWMIASYMGIKLPGAVYACLGLGVFGIYTLDHLLDVRRAYTAVSSTRHKFFMLYRDGMWLLWGIAVVTTLILLFWLPLPTIILGAVVTALTITYLYTINSRPYLAGRLKEVSAALIYALGVFTGPISLANGYGADVYWLFMQFILIALINLYLFSYLEVEVDEAAEYPSLMRTLGTAYSIGLIGLVILIAATSIPVGICLFGSQAGFIKVEVVLVLMLLSLAVIYFSPSRFRSGQVYRMLGDAVFFYPALLLLW